MSDQPTTNLEWALYYADFNWGVFPIWWIQEDGTCACGKQAEECNAGKHPITRNGLKDATSDEVQIRAWWNKYPNANIALATGEKSGVVVIDADGDVGMKSLKELEYPDTISAASGSGNGKHAFYAWPGVPLSNSSRENKPPAFKNIDFRADGGYIILPPSNHKNGNKYSWINPIEGDVKLQELPKHFMKHWLKMKVDEDVDDTGMDMPAKASDEDDSDAIITEGRNLFLTRKAGFLRMGGGIEDEILTVLRGINTRQCNPPLPDNEVVRIAQNIGNKPTGDAPHHIADASNLGNMGDKAIKPDLKISATLMNSNLSDTGNAECFVALFPNQFKWVVNKGKGAWYTWNGSKWCEDSGAIARRAMVVTIRERFEASHGMVKKQQKAALMRHCTTSENFGKLTSALAMAQNFEGVTADINDFDTDPYVLAMPNMIMDLHTGTTRKQTPEDMISRTLAVDYDPGAQCPKWRDFVLEIMGGDQDRATYLKRVVGHMLTGDMQEQKFFIFHGYGANGKSTFLSVIRDLFKDYAESVPFDSFDSDSQNEVGNDMARLQGVRFVPCIESEHSKKLAESRIKSITGGDPMICRFLYGEFFTFMPQFKIIMAVNHLPLIYGGGDGMWRRLSLIPFEQKFEGSSNNKNLKRELAEEMPGILNWCLEGFREWKALGTLDDPKAVQSAIDDYKVESDQLERFLEEAVEFNDKLPDHKAAKAASFYQAYRQWSVENGERTMGNNIFVKKLKEKGYERKRTSKAGGYIFPGIDLLVRTGALMGSFNEDLLH